jgi:hypothetical protein
MLRCAFAAILLASCIPSTLALTQEAAVENCRMTVGQPMVRACMQSLGGGKAPRGRSQSGSLPRQGEAAGPCLRNGRAERRQRPGQRRRRDSDRGCAESGSGRRSARGLCGSAVAPPRTIADVTAILESEKPDAKTIEQLKADADAKPTGKESREGLAQFYFDRGNVRAQLGRLADSIADANKAIEIGQGAVGPAMMGRLLQFATIQYSAAGDPKKAFGRSRCAPRAAGAPESPGQIQSN